MTQGQERVVAQAHGRVQGVSFRDFVVYHATRLGVVGYVRNLFGDMSVEVVAEGDHAALERLLEQVRQGPSWSRVERVEVEWLSSQGAFSEFTVQW